VDLSSTGEVVPQHPLEEFPPKWYAGSDEYFIENIPIERVTVEEMRISLTIEQAGDAHRAKVRFFPEH